MARNETFGLRKLLVALSAAILLLTLLAPAGVLAQSAKPAASAAAASPAQGASASASAPAAAGAPQPSTVAAPTGGVATPVGANAPQEQKEPVSIFAYLLIALAVVWFLAAIAGIIRILTRPAGGPYAQPLPADEADRGFLTFVMPFIALITVAIIVVVFGTLFLWLGSISPRAFDTEIYPLAVDLFIVAFVMFVATVLVLRQPGGKSSSAVH